MEELLRGALPLYPLTLLPALLVLVAPLCGRRGRTAIGGILVVAGLGFVASNLFVDAAALRLLDVPNVFPRGEKGEMYVWITSREVAPEWHWRTWLGLVLAVPGLVVLARRNRSPRAPSPVLFGTLLFLWYVTARFGLEKSACSRELAWAVGGTPLLLVLAPFVGGFCGARGTSPKGLLGAFLLMGLLQRIPLAVFSYFATTRQLGSHLDTHIVSEIQLFGERRVLADPVESWLWTTAVPHLTLWILTTVLIGVVLGSLPFIVAGKRARARAASVGQVTPGASALPDSSAPAAGSRSS